MLSYIKQRFIAGYFGYQAVVQPTKKRNNSIARPNKVVPTGEVSSYTASPVSQETYPHHSTPGISKRQQKTCRATVRSTTRFAATKNSPQLWLPTGTVVCMSPGGSERTQPKPQRSVGNLWNKTRFILQVCRTQIYSAIFNVHNVYSYYTQIQVADTRQWSVTRNGVLLGDSRSICENNTTSSTDWPSIGGDLPWNIEVLWRAESPIILHHMVSCKITMILTSLLTLVNLLEMLLPVHPGSWTHYLLEYHHSLAR